MLCFLNEAVYVKVFYAPVKFFNTILTIPTSKKPFHEKEQKHFHETIGKSKSSQFVINTSKCLLRIEFLSPDFRWVAKIASALVGSTRILAERAHNNLGWLNPCQSSHQMFTRCAEIQPLGQMPSRMNNLTLDSGTRGLLISCISYISFPRQKAKPLK